MMIQQWKTYLFIFVTLPLMAHSALAAPKVTYYHTDTAGSVLAASDDNGDLLWRKQYLPFGGQLPNSDATEKVSYTGKVKDKETGLTYFGARYYDPEIGRFISPDPVTPLAGVETNAFLFDRYTYAYNNPYTLKDPDGRFTVSAQYISSDQAYRYTFHFHEERGLAEAAARKIASGVFGRKGAAVKLTNGAAEFLGYPSAGELLLGQPAGVTIDDFAFFGGSENKETFKALDAAVKKIHDQRFSSGASLSRDSAEILLGIMAGVGDRGSELRETFSILYGPRANITQLLDASETSASKGIGKTSMEDATRSTNRTIYDRVDKGEREALGN